MEDAPLAEVTAERATAYIAGAGPVTRFWHRKHVHVNETYWYIEAVPELLQLAAERMMGDRTEVAR